MLNDTLPRAIPLKVMLGLYLSMDVLFGFLFQFVGVGFMIAGNDAADFKSLMYFRASDPLTSGVLTEKVESGARHSEKRGSSYYMYEYHYKYAVGSKSYQGMSFARENRMTSGTEIQVAYVPEKPEMSRIAGMTSAPFISTGFCMGIPGAVVALIGIAWFFGGFWKTTRTILLLRNGLLTNGIVTGRIATNTTIGGKRVYKIHFQFTHEDGRTCTGCVTTHETEQLEEEQVERVIYNAKMPSKATLVDALPKKYSLVRALIFTKVSGDVSTSH